MRIALALGLLSVGCAGSDVTPHEFLAPTTYTKTVVARELRPNVTVLLDTTMAPAQLSDAAAALSALVDARAAELRFAYVETGAACGLGTQHVALSSNVRDVPAELAASAAAVRAALAGATSTAGPRSIAAALAAQRSTTPQRQNFVLLVTGGEDACGGDAVAAAAVLKRDLNVRTIVVGFQPDAASAPGLQALALAGGFARQCPQRTDAECGGGDSCDATTGQCRRANHVATSGAELTALLLELTRTVDGGDVCKMVLDRPRRPSRVLLDGEALATDWFYADGVVRFTGATCGRLKESTVLDPVRLTVEVPRL